MLTFLYEYLSKDEQNGETAKTFNKKTTDSADAERIESLRKDFCLQCK